MPIAEITRSEYKDSVHQKAASRKTPLNALFELTYKCNLHCVMCYNAPQDRKELTTEQVFFILDELIKEGCLYLGLTGGEIMIRKDIFEILDYAVRKGFLLTLKSNATLLTSERIDRLQALGIDRMEVSFHGADVETFEGITQVKGSFERCKEVVQDLKRRNFNVKLNMVVMKTNADQVTAMRQFARSIGVSFSYSTEVTPRTNRDQTPVQYRISPKIEKALNTKQVPEDPKNRLAFFQQRLKTPVPRKQLFTCGVGKTQLVIGPYGDVRLCLDIEEPSYSVFEIGLKEAWEKLVDFVERKEAQKGRWECPEALRPFCTSWCPAKGFLEAGSLYGCGDHCQEQARLNKQEYEKLLETSRREEWVLPEETEQRKAEGCDFEREEVGYDQRKIYQAPGLPG